MKNISFSSLSRRLASVLGRRQGVKVVFAGTEAKTDGTEICLPSISEASLLSYEERLLFMGFLDHETMHVRFSDFDALQKRVDYHTSQGQPHLLSEDSDLKFICGVVEDVRGELRYIQEYPGSKLTLDCVCAHVDAKYKESLLETGENLGNLDRHKVLQLIAEHLFTYRGCALIRKESLSSFPSLSPFLPLLSSFPSLRSTSDALLFSERIYEEFLKLYPLPPPPSPGETKILSSDDE